MHTTAGKASGGWRGVFILSALILTLLVLLTPFHPNPPNQPHPSNPSGTPKYAFATFLSGHYSSANATTPDPSPNNPDSASDDDSDPYYLSTRLLAYQLLHSPVRSNLSIDFVVFITDDVSDPKRTRLMRDGASVVLAGKVHSDWLAPDDAPRNQNSLAKLRLWQMGQYERVCFLDPDHLVLGSLDGVFEDPAASMHKTRGDKFGVHSDEATLPASYSFAAQGDDKADSFSAGFFVTKPSLEMLSYYSSLLAAHIRGRFDNTQASPEQGLLNYAHRAKGNMPWQKLRGQWSVSGGGKRDWERGAVAFHERFWGDGDGVGKGRGKGEVDGWLVGQWREVRREMEGFWRVKEG